MTIPADETRLKELIKEAIVEVMEEQGFVRPQAPKPGNGFRFGIGKTVALWVALLVTAVLLYNVFQRG